MNIPLIESCTLTENHKEIQKERQKRFSQKKAQTLAFIESWSNKRTFKVDRYFSVKKCKEIRYDHLKNMSFINER